MTKLIYAIKQHGRYTQRNGLNDILGCSSIDFIIYYESLFSNGMAWNNHGEWENDHITPLITAKTIDDVRKLFHYTNLQPLWKSDNMRKKHYIDGIAPVHMYKPARVYSEYWPVQRIDDINRKPLSNNESKSTIAGVTFNKDRQKWRVRIKQKCYGLYDTLEEATSICINVRTKIYSK